MNQTLEGDANHSHGAGEQGERRRLRGSSGRASDGACGRAAVGADGGGAAASGGRASGDACGGAGEKLKRSQPKHIEPLTLGPWEPTRSKFIL
jgi:hypothetical protein